MSIACCRNAEKMDCRKCLLCTHGLIGRKHGEESSPPKIDLIVFCPWRKLLAHKSHCCHVPRDNLYALYSIASNNLTHLHSSQWAQAFVDR